MCNKCENHHSELFKNHIQFNLNSIKETEEIFTGLCTEKNHFIELKYFCKNHNKLCCAECIIKIKGEEFGQHNDCEVCTLNEIKSEKKNILKDNIKILEDLAINIKETIKEIKTIFEHLEDEKEKLKTEVQQAFTKLRNELNNKEDEILLEIDKKYEKSIFDKDLIVQNEKLPDKIDKSLQKGKLI